jgi:UDP-N-acetylmuramyl pentapeptide phosphotransferase/UDP-N-acetylglucosamine-1-phosphate transferase
MLSVVLVSFVVASVITLYVIHSAWAHAHVSGDHDFDGPQKVHARVVPRIGGIGVFGGMAAGLMLLAAVQPDNLHYSLGLLTCSLPAFAAGLLEDFTKRISPRQRLMATAVAAARAAWLLGATITRTDIAPLDYLVGFGVGAAALAIFVVAGVANAINIIDGMNGLASMCSAIMLAGLAYVALQTGDAYIAVVALATVGAILGFFMWNYPSGLIFLGDGGAYFLGFLLSELSILLLVRNAQVSPIFPLLLCAYPIFETLFSMYRRKVVRGRAVGMPDGIHLHSLIYRRLMRWAVGSQDAAALTRRNSMTSPYLWVLCSLTVMPSLLWWDSTPILASFLVLFAVSYVLLYWSIVKFKTPRALVLRRHMRPGPR